MKDYEMINISLQKGMWVDVIDDIRTNRFMAMNIRYYIDKNKEIEDLVDGYSTTAKYPYAINKLDDNDIIIVTIIDSDSGELKELEGRVSRFQFFMRL